MTPKTPPYELSPVRRDTARRLAQALIPESPLGPSAAEAHVATIHLDRALTLRPDRVALFESLLDEAESEVPRLYLDNLKEERPKDFEVFTFLMAGAYFLDPAVRQWLGYDGQVASPDLGPGPDETSEKDLLTLAARHGKTYRATTWKPLATAIGATAHD